MRSRHAFVFAGLLTFGGLAVPALTFAQDKPAPTLKTALLDQYKTTYNVEDWFVPVIQSVQGLTPEQAIWKPCDSCHSIAQEATHIIFWDKQSLAKFKGEKPDAFDGDNSKTFVNMDKAQWEAIVRELNQVLGDLQKAFETADEAKAKTMYAAISHISTHHAYHVGQILYIRKLQGSWNSNNGVK